MPSCARVERVARLHVSGRVVLDHERRRNAPAQPDDGRRDRRHGAGGDDRGRDDLGDRQVVEAARGRRAGREAARPELLDAAAHTHGGSRDDGRRPEDEDALGRAHVGVRLRVLHVEAGRRDSGDDARDLRDEAPVVRREMGVVLDVADAEREARRAEAERVVARHVVGRVDLVGVRHRVGLDGHGARLVALEIALRVEDVGRRGALGRHRQRYRAAGGARERERAGGGGHRLAEGDGDVRVGRHLGRAVRGSGRGHERRLVGRAEVARRVRGARAGRACREVGAVRVVVLAAAVVAEVCGRVRRRPGPAQRLRSSSPSFRSR